MFSSSDIGNTAQQPYRNKNSVKVNVAIASHMHCIFLKYHKMDYSQKGLLHFIIKERLQDLETS